MTEKTETAPTIVWFRDDLRITDNPALLATAERDAPAVALYVLDRSNTGARALGGASLWWLHKSLEALQGSLRSLDVPLVLRRGDPGKVVQELAREIGAGAVYWNRRYEPGSIEIDRRAKQDLEATGVDVRSFSASLLYEPWTIRTKSGTAYKVFTAFWKAARAKGQPRRPEPAPKSLPRLRPAPDGDNLPDWNLLPGKPDWAKGLRETWTPGEDGARKRLHDFLDDAVSDYAQDRDRPDRDGTSMLSPHLAFGEISPMEIWHTAHTRGDGKGITTFLSEIGWREFNYHLLYHFPDLPSKNLNDRFDSLSWRTDAKILKAWQKGLTGYPIIDAGMRQLWETGWMHNRVRMVVGSFLVKDLMLDWRKGEAWFWDTLVDADPANNTANWQWVAGTGVDAAPFFRIFNPVLQGRKFDPSGDYVRRFVPELARLPASHVHAPWQAPEKVLRQAGIELGKDYPFPVVDHQEARDRALSAFSNLPKQRNGANLNAS